VYYEAGGLNVKALREENGEPNHLLSDRQAQSFPQTRPLFHPRNAGFEDHHCLPRYKGLWQQTCVRPVVFVAVPGRKHSNVVNNSSEWLSWQQVAGAQALVCGVLPCRLHCAG
jgi:hypothetical protein